MSPKKEREKVHVAPLGGWCDSFSVLCDVCALYMYICCSMTGHFEVVAKQVEMGIYTTKRVAAVTKKLCQLELEYAKVGRRER